MGGPANRPRSRRQGGREVKEVTHPDERQQVRRQLEEYCALDTEGMVPILDALRKLAG